MFRFDGSNENDIDAYNEERARGFDNPGAAPAAARMWEAANVATRAARLAAAAEAAKAEAEAAKLKLKLPKLKLLNLQLTKLPKQLRQIL